MKQAIKYLKLYRQFFVINMKAVLVYELDAIFDIIAMFLKNAFQFILLLLIFQLVDNLKGFDFYHMLFFYGVSSISFALWKCFYINTLSLSYYIHTGKLDMFLKRPIHVLFSIVTDKFDEDAWGELLFAIIVTVIATTQLNIWSFRLLLLFPTAIFMSLIFAGISLLGSCASFFTITQTNLSSLVFPMQEFSRYPIVIFPKVLQYIFIFILPVAFVSYYPSLYFLFIAENVGVVFTSWIVAVIFFSVVCQLWNLSLTRYSSTGT